MDIKDILVKADFLNLTKNDIDNVVNTLDLEIPEGVEDRSHLYEMKNILFENVDVERITKSKVFAGRTSVKWFKFDFNNDEEKNKLIQKLESSENFFNRIVNIDTENLQAPRKYICIKNGDNTYIIRVMVPNGTKVINTGQDINRVITVNNVITIIDLENKYIEVRTNSRHAKRIIDIVYRPLEIENIIEVDLLSRYNGSMESFTDSLCNGKFVDVMSKPALNIDLTKEQNTLLVSGIKALDEYFSNKDFDKLKDDLDNIDVDTYDIPFAQLLLAGMSKIGIGTRVDIDEDLSSQYLYSLLKEHMDNQSGYITFTLPNQTDQHTLQVGKTTKSISFRSNISEDGIEYIRQKILGY